jgi:hypothetical protein
MKGIMVLSFHKKPGAFVDREYPEGISKDSKIDATEQNKIYSLHRMRNTRPNYLFIKAKGVQIASFYSGFDYKQYIGRPNQCISIILEEGENPTIWEDKLRRLTFDVLPKLKKARGDQIIISGLHRDHKYDDFDEYLGQKLGELQNDTIEPMYSGEGEHLEGTGAVIGTISGMSKKDMNKASLNKADVEAAKNSAMQQQPKAPEIDPIAEATKQMEEMEKNELRDEIRKLHDMIQQKDDRVRAVEVQLRESKIDKDTESGDIAQIRGEYEALLTTKEQELDMWRSKVVELNENNFINQDTIRKMTEMTMMMTDDAQNQAQSNMKLKKRIKSLEANTDAPSNLNPEEINTLRSHLAEVEETLSQKIEELEKKSRQIKELFMDNKKSAMQIADLKAYMEEKELFIEELQKKSTEIGSQPAQDPAQFQAVQDELALTKTKLQGAENQIEIATSQLLQAQDAIANLQDLPSSETPAPRPAFIPAPKPADNAPADESMSQIRIMELEDTVQKLEEELNEKSTESAASPVENSDSNRLLEEKLQDLEIQLESMKKELVNAKKTIKVQRREVDNLQKLLGL